MSFHVSSGRRQFVGAVLASGLPLWARAQKKYGPGVGDTEIKIGSTQPFSGPASAYGILGNTQIAYFRMINDQGGINGRKINLLSYDDAYNPSKSLEQTRRLVEQDEVLAVFSTIGTSPNTAIHRYLNQKKVPHVFVSSGATKWNDPANFPWTMSWQPNYETEGYLFGKHLLQVKPTGKVGVLLQNDDFGKDILGGFKKALGDKAASMIVLEATYEVADPTVDSQILRLKASGADVFVNLSTPKFAAQAIRKAFEIGWKPLQFLTYVSNPVGTTLKAAGLEASQDIVSSAFLKDPGDPKWQNDAGMQRFRAFMDRYNPQGDRNNALNVHAVGQAAGMVKVLDMCGDNLTRDNLMRQMASMKDIELDVLLPGIRMNTSPQNFAPIKQMQLSVFKADRWELFGPVLSMTQA